MTITREFQSIFRIKILLESEERHEYFERREERDGPVSAMGPPGLTFHATLHADLFEGLLQEKCSSLRVRRAHISKHPPDPPPAALPDGGTQNKREGGGRRPRLLTDGGSSRGRHPVQPSQFRGSPAEIEINRRGALQLTCI